MGLTGWNCCSFVGFNSYLVQLIAGQRWRRWDAFAARHAALHIAAAHAGGAVELAGRLEQAGLVARKGDPQDKRRVLLTLTDTGAERLTDLARAHSLELGKTRDVMIKTLKTLPGGN